MRNEPSARDAARRRTSVAAMPSPKAAPVGAGAATRKVPEESRRSSRKKIWPFLKNLGSTVEVEGPDGTIKRKLGRLDVPLFTLTLILLAFGLVMLYSASYANGILRRGDSMYYISSQLQFAVLGFVGMMVASVIDYHLLRRFAWPLMALTLFLLILVLFMPEGSYGGHRWIWLNPGRTQSFQPSELAKFALILIFASLITVHKNRMKSFKYGFMPFAIILGAIALLLILEPHLSCTILILGIGVAMMFAGGTPLRWFAIAGGLGAAALWLVVTQFPDAIPYAGTRISTWLDPMSADGAAAYQVQQSLIAVGSGGLFGKGIGKSVRKLLYLPEMHNDYIFAIVCEELGFVGALAVITLFFLLLARGIFIALRAKDKFGGMLAIGISVQIALQAFLHIAVNINLIPSTGISLPFFSSGGTALVMIMTQMGVLISVSRQADLGLVRTKDPENSWVQEDARPEVEEKEATARREI